MPPLPSIIWGVDQGDPGVRIDTVDPRTARQVPGTGHDTAASPVVPGGHGPGPAVHEVPSQSRTVSPTTAVQADASAHDSPTRPAWNSSTEVEPDRVVIACGADQVVPCNVATCPVLST